VQCRRFSGGRFPFQSGPDRGMEDTWWKVTAITKERGDARVGGRSLQTTHRQETVLPRYVARVSSSDSFRRKFPGTKGSQLAFDTYRKVE